MKHPLWLVNTIALCIFVLILGVLLLLRPKKSFFVPYMPEEGEVQPPKLTIPKIDLATIYSNDLFDTYQAPVTPAEPKELVSALPKPPQIKPPRPAIKPTPKLLDPLQVTLNGIMITGDDATNVAILKNTKTGESKNYKIGDKIEDAQLIRIMKNKIIIIRSNGQQETLYVNQHDAELDQLITPQKDWSKVVTKADDNTYTVDPNAFGAKIQNLAQFIDVLNLTTVYKQGKSVGCRVGRIPSNSLATSLGLQTGDIITTVNGIPATDTDNRYTIYQNVTALGLGDAVTINLQRNGLEHSITYTLKELEPIADKEPQKETLEHLVYPEKTMADVQAEKQRIMKERYKYAPTARQLERQQKTTMVQPKRRRTARKRNVLTKKLEHE